LNLFSTLTSLDVVDLMQMLCGLWRRREEAGGRQSGVMLVAEDRWQMTAEKSNGSGKVKIETRRTRSYSSEAKSTTTTTATMKAAMVLIR
jgi:hypothetical protein